MRVLASFLAMAAAIGMSTATHATEISQVGTVSTTTTDFSVPYTVTTSPFANLGTTTFDGFDASLGTLNSVSVTVTNNATSSGTLTNTSGTTQNFTFTLSLDTYLTSGPASLLSTFGQYQAGDTTFQSPKFRYTNVANNSSVNFPASGSNAFTASGGVNPVTTGSGDPLSYTATTSSGLSLSDFLSDFSVGFGTTGGSTTTGGTSLSTNILTQAGSTLEVDYFYTPSLPVPEPASMALLGIGLAGVGFVGRRKHSA